MVGRWHRGLIYGDATDGSNAAVPAGVLCCTPAWSNGEVIDALWFNPVTVTTGMTNARLGLYGVRADGRPGELIFAAPVIASIPSGGQRTVNFPAFQIPHGPFFYVFTYDTGSMSHAVGPSHTSTIDARNWC